MAAICCQFSWFHQAAKWEREKYLLFYFCYLTLKKQDFIKCNISKKNITRKNLELGEHWELQFKTESDLLNSREIIQKHTDVYTIIEKDQINKSRNGEDQVEEGEEEEYEIIWSH